MDLFSRRRRAEPAAAAPASGERAARVLASEVPAASEVRLSPGGPADLINLSESGALVETRSRLAVDAKVTVSIGGAKPQRLAGRVVRCQVCAIHRDNTMSYQLGIAFEQAAGLDLLADRAELPDGAEPPAAGRDLAAGASDEVATGPTAALAQSPPQAPAPAPSNGAAGESGIVGPVAAGPGLPAESAPTGSGLSSDSTFASIDVAAAGEGVELVNEW